MTGLPMLNGWGDDIARAVNQIGPSIRNIINPQYDLQRNLQKQLTENPAMLQQIIDEEFLNPGSTKKMYGRQAEHLGTGSASYEAQLAKYLRDNANQNVDETPNSMIAQNALRKVTGDTTLDRVSKRANTAAQESQTRYYNLEQEFKKKQQAEWDADAPIRADQRDIILQGLKAFPDIKGINIDKAVNDIINGGPIDSNLLSRIQNTPLKTVFDNVLATRGQRENAKKAFENEKTLIALRKRGDSDILERQLLMKGIDAYQKSGVGSARSWVDFYDKPEVYERAILLAQGKEEAKTPQDKQLIEMVKSVAKDRDMQRDLDLSKLINNFDVAQIRYGKNPKDKEALLGAQGQLDILNSQFGTDFAIKPPSGWFGKTKVIKRSNPKQEIEYDDLLSNAFQLDRFSQSLEQQNQVSQMDDQIAQSLISGESSEENLNDLVARGQMTKQRAVAILNAVKLKKTNKVP